MKKIIRVFFFLYFPTSAFAESELPPNKNADISKQDIKKKNIQIQRENIKDLPAIPMKSHDNETTRFPSRSVYLNGVNISSVRDEILENVRIEIDKNGNVLISAPHYEVTQESSYHPLLQSELPKFPREQIKAEGMPEGVYSKKTGKKVPATEARLDDVEDEKEEAPIVPPAPDKKQK